MPNWLFHCILYYCFMNMLVVNKCCMSLRNFKQPRISSISLSKRFLNRIMFNSADIITANAEDKQHLTVRFLAEDSRAKHITEVLKLEMGDSVRVGIIDQGMTNGATITALPTATTDNSVVVDIGTQSSLVRCEPPRIDLILAMPRPIRLERLLSVVSCQGVRKIMLTTAQKVEKQYFGSGIIANPAKITAHLVDGLAQAETDYHLPVVSVHRNLRRLVDEELDSIIGSASGDSGGTVYKLIAHPPFVRDAAAALLVNATADCISPSDRQQVVIQGGMRITPILNSLHAAALAKAAIARVVPTTAATKAGQLCSDAPGGAIEQQTDVPESRQHSNIMTDSAINMESESITERTVQRPLPSPRVVIAIGPEGGWLQEEVEMFEKRGFHCVSMGERILRTDIAVPVALGTIHEWLAAHPDPV